MRVLDCLDLMHEDSGLNRADDQVLLACGFSSVRPADLSATLKCAGVEVQSHSW